MSDVKGRRPEGMRQAKKQKRVPLNLHEEHGRSLDVKVCYTVRSHEHEFGTRSTCRI
jgi:hypothetical protein